MKRNEVLDQLENNEISTKKAYRLLVKEPKPVKMRRASFIKVRISIPEEKGVNTLLKFLLALPFPIFVFKLFIKRRKTFKIQQLELSGEELIDLISYRGILVQVKSQDGVKIHIKTI
jgi:hypothetical protein